MKLTLLASAWAFGGLDACVRELAHATIDGVEGPPPADFARARELERELALARVPYVAEVCTGGSYAPASSVPFAAHIEDFRRQAELSAAAGASFITCLGGSDSWPLARSVEFYARALDIAERLGLDVSFETHRSRPTFHPWATAELLRTMPALELTVDFSHWCVVCERLVDDEAALGLAIARARHVHARVGYAQGPQVPDPRAPEYERELLAHESWWLRAAQAARGRGRTTFTVTPEFGPDGYLQCAPYSRVPVADLAEINRWMALRLRETLGPACSDYPADHSDGS
jgi:sugar phosphate isomerase/epimerase